MSALLDRFISVDSPIHRLDPRVKLLATVGFIVGNVLLPDGAWLAFAAAWLLTLWISAFARLGVGFALKRSFIALPFMLAGFSVVFATPGREIAQWTPLGLDLRVTDAGVVRFISIMLRTWLSVQMAILLTATTDFPALTHALRHLKVPAVLVSIIAFMYRYLFVLVEEAQRLLRARASRSAVLPGQKGGGGLLWRAKVAGNMGGQLLVRSMARADRVYMAMQARGYRGELLTMTRHTMQRRDWQAAALMLLLLAAVQLVGRV
ncbi:MAG: cobalt ECF transporter T component CbiQ [Anaerolineales bacterium]|nr:cobalt ECF transporter T component CbiQ [Anaerolineales bacterium]